DPGGTNGVERTSPAVDPCPEGVLESRRVQRGDESGPGGWGRCARSPALARRPAMERGHELHAGSGGDEGPPRGPGPDLLSPEAVLRAVVGPNGGGQPTNWPIDVAGARAARNPDTGSMRGWLRDRIATAPLWALFLGSAAYFA